MKKDNNVSKKKNIKTNKVSSSNSNGDYDKDNTSTRFGNFLKEYPELKLKRARRNKVKIGHDVLPALRDALERAVSASGEPRHVILDRFILDGLKKEFPEIFEQYEVERDQTVLLKRGRPAANADADADDDSFDPQPS